MDKVLTVRFMGRQSAEDLYRNVETGRVYVRQPANVDSIAFWLTSSKWTGGYEADCPIREGIAMRVVDKSDKVLFEELLEKDDWNSGTSAKKVGKFSYEAYRDLEHIWAEKLNLHPYEEWKGYVLRDMANCSYKGYSENWLYAEVEYREVEVLDRVKVLGEELHILKEKAIHKISGKAWECVAIHTKDHCECLGICGYIWKDVTA